MAGPDDMPLTDAQKVIAESVTLSFAEILTWEWCSSSTGWELPGHIPFDVTKALVVQFISCFEDIFAELFSFGITCASLSSSRIISSGVMILFSAGLTLRAFILISSVTRIELSKSEYT